MILWTFSERVKISSQMNVGLSECRECTLPAEQMLRYFVKKDDSGASDTIMLHAIFIEECYIIAALALSHGEDN